MKKAILLSVFFIFIGSSFSQILDNKYQFLVDNFNQFPENERNKDRLSVLAEEICDFVSENPQFSKNYELLNILGLLYEKIENYDGAVLAFFKNIRLFPDSERKSNSIESLKKILQNYKKIELYRDIILKEIEKDQSDFKFQERFYNYLKDINGINYGGFSDFLIRDAYTYLNKFDIEQEDEIYIFIGDWYFRNNKSEKALFIYRMVEEVYENSLYVPYAMLSRGNILENPLNRHHEALNVLKRMIQKFPDHPSVIQARLIKGEIYERKLKDYIQSIAEYKLIVAQFPEDHRCPDALFQISKIYRGKLNDPHKAIEALDQLYTNYPNDFQAAKAVHLIGEIFEKDIKDYRMTIDYYKKVAELYPDSEYVIDDLEKAAEIAEKKLKDNNKAIEIYSVLQDKLTDEKDKRKIRDKINKLKNN